MRKPSSRTDALITIACLAFILFFPVVAILQTTGCGHLDPAGVYGGDKVLYDTDFVLGSSYDTIDGFLSWELKYRGTPVCPAAATKAADQIRRAAPKAFADAWAARSAYVAAKTDQTKTSLQKSLDIVRQLLTIAVSWTPTRAQNP